MAFMAIITGSGPLFYILLGFRYIQNPSKHAPNDLVLGIWVIVSVGQVWGKYMTIGYLDP